MLRMMYTAPGLKNEFILTICFCIIHENSVVEMKTGDILYCSLDLLVDSYMYDPVSNIMYV